MYAYLDIVAPELETAQAKQPTSMLPTQPKPLFLLGDETIDRDHSAITEQIQAVIDSDNVALPTSLRTLLAHIEQHFERETALMEKYRYRGMRDHKAEHTLLLREFHRCLERVDGGFPELARTFMVERLTPWFEVHISSMDFVLVLHLQKQAGTLR